MNAGRPRGPEDPARRDDDGVGRPGPYEQAALDLMDALASTWPGLDRRSVALAVPLWLVRRLSDEIDQQISRLSGGLETIDLRGTLVVGAGLLQRGPLGTFLAQDLIGGGTYPLPLRCHPDVDPGGWRALTLAIQIGLNPAAALALAELDA